MKWEKMQVFGAFRTVRPSQKQESDLRFPILQATKFYNFETSRFSPPLPPCELNFETPSIDRNNWFATFDVKFNVRFDL